MSGWYLWFEIEATDKDSAAAKGLIMGSTIHRAKLVHVQSMASYEIAKEEEAASKRNKRLRIKDTTEDTEC